MKKVLVVDDDPDCSLFLQKILEHNGYQIVVKNSGETAILALSRESFDGMILDISLPDMDGLMVAKKTREIKGDSFPLIALTGHPLELLKKQNPDVEKIFSEILTKPLDINSVLELSQKFS